MAGKKQEVIEITPIEVKYLTITIAGDTDLRLHKMDASNRKMLSDKQKGKEVKKSAGVDKWMQAISTINWRDGEPAEYTEEAYYEALKTNAPCISGFGLRKSFGDAVVRNGFDTYATKLMASMQIVEDYIPITFAECRLIEQLVPAKMGAPILNYINQFKGWKATFTLRYIENYYSTEQLINFIKYAGFGIGIGSGRAGKSGSNYGSYHIESIS
jgi:hypothetical protein